MDGTGYLIIAVIDGMPEINAFKSIKAARAFAEDLKKEGTPYTLAEKLETFQGEAVWP